MRASKHLKVKNILFFVFFLGCGIFTGGLFSTSTVHAAVDACSWTGAANANWSDPGNWSGCDNGNTPEDGDSVIFPASASNKTMNNDTSIRYNIVYFQGDGYTLNGSTLNIGRPAEAPGLYFAGTATNNVINTNITWQGASAYFVGGTDAAATNTLAGTINYSGLDPAASVTWGLAGQNAGTINTTGAQTGAIPGGMLVNMKTVFNNTTASNFTVAVSGSIGVFNSGSINCKTNSCFGDASNRVAQLGGGQIIFSQSGLVIPNVSFLLNVDNAAPTVPAILATANVTLSGDIITNTATIHANNGVAVALDGVASQIAATRTLTLEGQSLSSTFSQIGIMGGDGNLIVKDTVATLGGDNTYTGTTTIRPSSVVMLTHENGLGSTAGSTIIESGGTLGHSTPALTSVAENITLSGSGAGGIYNGALYNNGQDQTYIGTITLGSDTTVWSDGGSISIIGAITGSGNLTTYQEGTPGKGVFLGLGGGPANTFSGDLYIIGGAVGLIKQDAMPGDVYLQATAPLIRPVTLAIAGTDFGVQDVMSDTSVIHFNDASDKVALTVGASETIRGFTGSDGTIDFPGSAELRVTQDYNETFGGQFTGTGKLTKDGSGELVLNRATPSTGTATLEARAGLLTIDTDYTTHPVFINGGTLRGTGLVGTITGFGAAGHIAPGHSPGCMTAASLALVPSDTLDIELVGTTPCTQYDRLDVTGTADLGGSTLNIATSFTPSASDEFTILTASSVVGIFNGLPNNSTINVSGLDFRIVYSATNVKLVYIAGTVVTPPGGNGNTQATPLEVAQNLLNTGDSLKGAIAMSIVMLLCVALIVYKGQKIRRTRLHR